MARTLAASLLPVVHVRYYLPKGQTNQAGNALPAGDRWIAPGDRVREPTDQVQVMSSPQSRRAQMGRSHALDFQRQLTPSPFSRSDWVVALSAALILGWLALVFLVDPVRFVVFNPRAKTGFEVFLAISQLFGALILALAPATEDMRWRLRWVAAGFFLLGVGALGFGYLYPLLTDTPHLGATMYGSLYVRAVSAALVATGLLPAIPLQVRRAEALGLAVIVVVGGIAIAALAEHLPPLVRVEGMGDIIDHDPALDAGATIRHAHLADLEQVVSSARTVFPGLTSLHWGVSLIPLAAALAAISGAWLQHRRRPLSTWLLVAIVLFAGAQLHSLFWPTMYSSIMTTTSMLRMGMAAVVIVGGILEFRRLVEERAVLLAGERERVARLEELAELKADFTSIVAHELVSPMVAITTMGEMLATGALSAEQGKHIGEQIVGEGQLLQLLVTDMRTSAEVERDDFRIQPRRTSVASALANAEAYARTLPKTHDISFGPSPEADIQADPARLGQVLRNLLTNAMRHTPAGTAVSVGATMLGDRVRFSVSDEGPGIAPEDQARIFEKFGRSHDTSLQQTPGFGLGLYLSRRILQAHGSDLEVASTPGQGTTFWFTLEQAP